MAPITDRPPPAPHLVCGIAKVLKTHALESDVDRNPKERAEVTIDYTASYKADEDAEAVQFDEKAGYTFELYPTPPSFRVFGTDDNHCPLPVLSEAITTMRPGEQASFAIPPESAFGEEGNSELGVPPNATVTYHVTLHDFRQVELVDHENDILRLLLKQRDEKELYCPGPQDEVYVRFTVYTSPDCTPDSLKYATPEDGVESFALDELPAHVPPGVARACRTVSKTERCRFALRTRDTAGTPKPLYVDLEVLKWKERKSVPHTNDKAVKLFFEIEKEDSYDKPPEFSTIRWQLLRVRDADTGEELIGEAEAESVVLHAEPPDLPACLEDAACMTRVGETAYVTVSDVSIVSESDHVRMKHVCLPAGCTAKRVVYETKLLEVVEKGMNANDDARGLRDASVEDKLELAENRKSTASLAMRRGANDRALRFYTDALFFCSKVPKDDLTTNLRLALHNNTAMVCLKLDKYQPALKACSKALEIDPSNVKALFRRAKAYEGIGDFEESARDLKSAIRIEPNNNDLRAEYDGLKVRAKEAAAKAKEMWGSKLGAPKAAA